MATKAATKKIAPVKKPAAQKAPVKKVAAKKPAPAKKAAPVAAASAELKPIKENLGKNALLLKLAEVSGGELKEVRKFYAALESIALASINKKGAGTFTLPGLFKVKTTKVAAKKFPAIKAGTPVRNPGTGEMIPSKGRAAYTKPATIKVSVRPLKKIKDAAL